MAQHVQRIIWRSSDMGWDLDVYMTTTVKFGDEPAGCITIAATQKTAHLFGERNYDAAWFLTERTFVDNATAGADTREKLHRLSW
jgi:hypothetical protein